MVPGPWSLCRGTLRIFSPREWQGLLHWGLSWHHRDSPDSLALIRRTEEQVYDTTGLAEFIDDRIKGRVDWEYGYPLDNPMMMDRLRWLHPRFPYDRVTLNTDRSEA